MIINIFLKANTRANTKYYSVMHLSQNRVKLNIIHGRPHTVCPSSAKTTTEGKPLKKKNEKGCGGAGQHSLPLKYSLALLVVAAGNQRH